MGDMLYVKEGKIYAKDYMEIYIPLSYFVAGRYAVNMGSSVETFGLLYVGDFSNGNDRVIKFMNIPAVIDIMLYESTNDEINVHGITIPVMVLKYIKDSYILHPTLQRGKQVAETFLDSILSGKLPKSLDYNKIIDIWWKNLEISGVSFNVPSKIYEMIIANIYRSPNNFKDRFGQYYGKQSNGDSFNYKTGNVRDIVEGLSTFSGMVFEDMGRMITAGINNSIDGIEEPVSPLEKIIYY